MLKPKLFLAAYVDLLLKKHAKIEFENCAIFLNKLGSAITLSSELCLAENLWDEGVLQTLKSKGYIAMADGFHLKKIEDKICFEQLLLERFTYTKARKSIPTFFKEFLEYKTIFN